MTSNADCAHQVPSRPSETPIQQFDRLLDELSQSLNALHNVDYPKRFWGILLYRYICKCIQVYNGQLPLSPLPTYISNDDTILEKKATEAAADAGWTSFPQQARGLFKMGLHTVKRVRSIDWVNARVVQVSRRRWASAASLVTGFHQYPVILRRVAQPVARMRTRAGDWQASGDPAKRHAIAALREGTQCPLMQLTLDWLPSWYVEEFEAIHRSVDVPGAVGKQIHASFLPRVENRMAVAKYVAAGAHFSLYQHSGVYGEVKDYLLHYAESSIADRFRTWGWKINANDEPYLALRLMTTGKPAPRPEANTAGSWIYVLGRQPIPTNLEITLAIQRRFFPALSDKAAGNIVIRTRTNKGGSWWLQVTDEARSRIKGVDDGKAGIRNMTSEAGMLILDTFPTTAFMECLTGGIPVIAMVPSGLAFTEIANVFYDEFFRLGLLHKSPESAANFLNGLELAGWWRDLRRTDCFQQYLSTFCNCDETRVVA